MYRTLFAGVTALALIATGLATPVLAQSAAAAASTAVPTITTAQLKKLQKSHASFYVIDVRTPAEFTAGHIDGAISMPLDNLDHSYHQIPKGVELVVNCRSGVRSAKAVAFLRQHGYTKAFSLAGGYLAWTGH